MIKTDEYKNQEALHYDKKANLDKKTTLNTSDFITRQSRQFYYQHIEEYVKNKSDLNILDYGCGCGEKHIELASKNNIVGIDISSKSIEVANNYAIENNLNAKYSVMDCEKMSFPANYFDIVLDFGTFSSLNFYHATMEIQRVLKKEGALICIETYGHNPFMKIKRYFNVILGKRTKWAANHIMLSNNWKDLKSQFEHMEIKYFHITVLFLPVIFRIFPFLSKEALLNFFEKVDSKLLSFKIFHFLAFKTVVLLKTLSKQ